jgi:hypothetical protein
VIRTAQYQWSASSGWSNEPEDRNGPAQIVLLFGEADLVRTSQCIELARQRFPAAQIFGCTTGAEIHGRSVGNNTLSLTALSFEHTQVRSSLVPLAAPENSFEAGQRLARSFDPHGLRHILVLSEGIQVHGNALVNGLNSALPAGVTLSGGFAADDFKLADTSVWCNGLPQRNTVVGLGFYGERLKIGMAATGGWDAFGTDRKITRSRGNVLYDLDGKSAFSLYKKYLGDQANGLASNGLLFPLELSVNVGDTQRHVLRAILAVNEEEESITYAGEVPEGTYARLMFGNIDHLVDGAERAAHESIADLGAQAEFALLVSCNGRRPVLRHRIEEEVEVVSDVLSNTTTLTGFYSNGEIAPAGPGGQAQLHNETMAITAFAEV